MAATRSRRERDVAVRVADDERLAGRPGRDLVAAVGSRPADLADPARRAGGVQLQQEGVAVGGLCPAPAGEREGAERRVVRERTRDEGVPGSVDVAVEGVVDARAAEAPDPQRPPRRSGWSPRTRPTPRRRRRDAGRCRRRRRSPGRPPAPPRRTRRSGRASAHRRSTRRRRGAPRASRQARDRPVVDEIGPPRAEHKRPGVSPCALPGGRVGQPRREPPKRAWRNSRTSNGTGRSAGAARSR